MSLAGIKHDIRIGGDKEIFDLHRRVLQKASSIATIKKDDRLILTCQDMALTFYGNQLLYTV